MAINKVKYGNTTLIDLTDTTATADKILTGYGAYGKDGVWMNGSASTGSGAVADEVTTLAGGGDHHNVYGVDLTLDTVTAGSMLSGITAHDSEGNAITGTIANGSAKTPATTITANPTISVNSSGLITATTSKTQSVTPTVTAGYVSSGTAGTITVSGSNTQQLTTKGATTYTPTTTNQTIASGTYLTGAQTISGDSNLVASNIKKDVEIFGVTGTYEGSGGGTVSAEEKDVNFYDYDGTLLHSYTAQEFAQLSDLPRNPSHSGLIAQGWNWTKAEIASQLANVGGVVNVGQMYTTSSGKTEIDIKLDNPDLLTPYLHFAINGTAIIDWGDNSATETVTGTALQTSKYFPHSYVSTGKYTITIEVTDGTFNFYENYILTVRDALPNEARRYNSTIIAVRIGNGVNQIGAYAFQYCYSLQTITIPYGVTSIGAYALRYCSVLTTVIIPNTITQLGNNLYGYSYSLRVISMPSGYIGSPNSLFQYCSCLQTITIPYGVTTMSTYEFYNCYPLKSIIIPNTVTEIQQSAFQTCSCLQTLTIPSGVTSIGSSAFSNCYSIYEFHLLPTTPPTLANTNAFNGISSDCKIYVPQESLEAYQTATNWSTYTSYMVGE